MYCVTLSYTLYLCTSFKKYLDIKVAWILITHGQILAEKKLYFILISSLLLNMAGVGLSAMLSPVQINFQIFQYLFFNYSEILILFYIT